MAIAAVFDSWNGRRAQDYRRIHRISDELGTAVNVQAMVFGNLGWDSGTGVAFTRNPSTGENQLYGEYLLNAQGEDVVAGIRTPHPIAQLATDMPGVHQQLLTITGQLEKHYQNMQDIEFTIEQGKLWLLQTRDGKRTAQAESSRTPSMMRNGLGLKGGARNFIVFRIRGRPSDPAQTKRQNLRASLTRSGGASLSLRAELAKQDMATV